MNKFIQKDKKIRKIYNKQELNYIILKSLIKNENFSLLVKWNIILKLSNSVKTKSKVRFVQRCLLTNRKAKFNRIYNKFSRLSFLRLARNGDISGIRKSSW